MTESHEWDIYEAVLGHPPPDGHDWEPFGVWRALIPWDPVTMIVWRRRRTLEERGLVSTMNDQVPQ